MEGIFALPPSAKPTPPVSPKDRLQTSPRHKRTSSSVMKAKEQEHELPPPPSRPRKIIQMKPKSASSSSTSDYTPPAKSTGTKRKQPSSNSAAGRKIARKTAHSIIERRRRSKMNEEFGVLKDMIPACGGVEMHKLAILQAGIEYVRYLEGCVKQLQGEREESEEVGSPPERTTTASTMDWEYRKPSIPASSSSSNPSPEITARPAQPQHRPVLPSIPSFTGSLPGSHLVTPTPTLLSPAFNAIHFSPNLARSSTNSTSTSMSIHDASPTILPLPQAMMALNRDTNKSPMSEGRAEATATAALMMLTNDRRAMDGRETGKGSGMSVRDLLTA